MISKTVYSLKWVKQYVLNRYSYVLLTLIASIALLGYFNISMSAEINVPSTVLANLDDSDYVYVGVTNHSNYKGNNFYQQIDSGYFYSQKSGINEYSGKIDAVGLKRLSEKEYTDSSLVERCEMLYGRAAENESEVVLSENTAQRYKLTVGSTIYFDSLNCRREFVVSGICSSFYGVYEIDTVANCGLIMLHTDADIESSTFIQFVKTSENDTYAEIYIKSHEVERLDEIITSSVAQSFIFSLILVIAVFLFLNIKMNKYVLRLKNEHCKRIHISVFLFAVVFLILFISFVPITLVILISDSLSNIALKIMLFEFLSILIFLFAVLCLRFLRRNHR